MPKSRIKLLEIRTRREIPAALESAVLQSSGSLGAVEEFSSEQIRQQFGQIKSCFVRQIIGREPEQPSAKKKNLDLSR